MVLHKYSVYSKFKIVCLMCSAIYSFQDDLDHLYNLRFGTSLQNLGCHPAPRSTTCVSDAILPFPTRLLLEEKKNHYYICETQETSLTTLPLKPQTPDKCASLFVRLFFHAHRTKVILQIETSKH